MEIGADGFLPKNCDKERLLEALDTVFRGEKYFAEDLSRLVPTKFSAVVKD